MKKNSADLTQLDFRDVKFPSDDLTVGALRKKHWSLFDDGFDDGEKAQPQFFLNGQLFEHSADVLGHLLFSERVVATCAYADVEGVRRPQCDFDSHKQELAKLYVRYGLAAGKNEALLLVRELEEQGHDLSRSPTWRRDPGSGGR
jgi:hypothetical protein